MPLLSLLQLQPLQVQAAHLSFQEYFAARQICEGARLPAKPWELPLSWANMVRLGAEMGDAFGRGLPVALGMKPWLNEKAVRATLGRHRPTAASALGAALRAAVAIEEVRVGSVALLLGGLRGGMTVLELQGLSSINELDVMVLSGFISATPALAVRTATLASGSVSSDVMTALAAMPTLTRLEIVGKLSERTMRAAEASSPSAVIEAPAPPPSNAPDGARPCGAEARAAAVECAPHTHRQGGAPRPRRGAVGRLCEPRGGALQGQVRRRLPQAGASLRRHQPRRARST